MSGLEVNPRGPPRADSRRRLRWTRFHGSLRVCSAGPSSIGGPVVFLPYPAHGRSRRSTSRSLRSVAHRLSPRRRRAHGALQLALRAQVRRPVPAPHRGHRQGAQHRREHARDLRGPRVARPQLGRGGRLSGREPRAPSAPTRSACSTTGTAYRCFCTPAELDEQRAGGGGAQGQLQVRPPLRPPRAERDRSAASRPAMPFVVRFRVPEGDDRVGRRGARAHRVPEQGHRGLRHPPLRRDADLQSRRRVATTSPWASRS